MGKEKIEYLMQGHALRERYLQDDTQILMTMIRMVLQRDHPRFLGFPLTLKSVMMKKMNKARRLERPLVLLSKIFFYLLLELIVLLYLKSQSDCSTKLHGRVIYGYGLNRRCPAKKLMKLESLMQ